MPAYVHRRHQTAGINQREWAEQTQRPAHRRLVCRTCLANSKANSWRRTGFSPADHPVAPCNPPLQSVDMFISIKRAHASPTINRFDWPCVSLSSISRWWSTIASSPHDKRLDIEITFWLRRRWWPVLICIPFSSSVSSGERRRRVQVLARRGHLRLSKRSRAHHGASTTSQPRQQLLQRRHQPSSTAGARYPPGWSSFSCLFFFSLSFSLTFFRGFRSSYRFLLKTPPLANAGDVCRTIGLAYVRWDESTPLVFGAPWWIPATGDEKKKRDENKKGLFRGAFLLLASAIWRWSIGAPWSELPFSTFSHRRLFA